MGRYAHFAVIYGGEVDEETLSIFEKAVDEKLEAYVSTKNYIGIPIIEMNEVMYALFVDKHGEGYVLSQEFPELERTEALLKYVPNPRLVAFMEVW
jgi:hypothetical protein